MEITTEYNSWYIIGCAALAGLYTFFLYWKNVQHKDVNPIWIRLLSGLRFVTIFVLALLVLNPLIQKWIVQTQDPIIIIAQDVSESIRNNKDSVYYTTEYLKELNQLKEAISENFEVVFIPFGGEVLPDTGGFTFSEKRTNYAKVFDEIDARYAGENIGGVILASDGLFNVGAHPNYYNFKQLYPIYTLGLGDTSLKSDISIPEVLTNDIVYLGNQFPVEVGVSALLLKGKSAELTVSQNGKVLIKRTLQVQLDNDYFTEKFVFTAEKEGTQRYVISVTQFDNELNLINNQNQILIDVIDNRDKVLLLANAPHPDVAVIRGALEKKDNIELDVAFVSDLEQVLSSYNLIIAHGFGDKSNRQIWQKVWETKVPLWVIMNSTTNLNGLNSLKMGFELSGRSNKSNRMKNAVNSGFDNFRLSKETISFLENCPPLTCAHGEINGVLESQVLVYQKLGNVETENPLLHFGLRENTKTAWLFGEGIWQWKMYDFVENENQEHLDELVSKIAQYLSVKEDKSRFRVAVNKRFNESENVKIKAELYDKSYALVNDQEVRLVIENENQKTFNYIFNAIGSGYGLDLGKLKAGVYSYAAETTKGAEKFTKNGQFIVKPLNVEWQKVSADFGVLQALSEKTKGQFFERDQLNDLKVLFSDKSKFPSISYTSETKKSMLHEKWIFFLILLLLTLEWGVRKYKGRY